MARKSRDSADDARVEVTRADKPFFPDDGISKGDLVGYYRQVAPAILPYLRDRPLVMDRYPDGITGQRIVQKNVSRHFPDWVSRTEVGKKGGAVCHVVADKPATLAYLANQACVELHVFLSRLGELDRPDQLVFDLDPPDGSAGSGGDDPPAPLRGFLDACRHAADLRELLEGELGLTAYVKTTGGKGLHVHVPVRPEEDFDSVRDFAREAAAILVSRSPGELTLEQRKNQRGQRLYLDVMRNAYAQTVIAPYAVRARPGAPVATPLGWEELSDRALSPGRFSLRTMADRLASSADPWEGMARHRHGLAGPRRRLEGLRAGAPVSRLAGHPKERNGEGK